MTNTTTSNTPEASVLKSLRSLMPRRVLSYSEALSRAELQASRLLALAGIQHGPVPIEIVTELPRIRVEQTSDLPVSGSAHWDGGTWVLTVNASEYSLRQRFSVMHEFKHVLDHPIRHLIQHDTRQKLSAEQTVEKIADYFAACVLMPKAWVKDAFCNQGVQNIEALANHFQVSQKAMSFRLHQLGLTTPVERCVPAFGASVFRPSSAPARPASPTSLPRRYHRALSTATRSVLT
jgi:predicted transcriptional regulator